MNTTGLYRDVTARSKIFRLLLVAFGVQFLSKWQTGNKNYSNQTRKIASTEINLIGWFAVWLVLTLAAEYDTTTDLAVSFAMLLMIVVLSLDGIKAFQNVQILVASLSPKNTPPMYNPSET